MESIKTTNECFVCGDTIDLHAQVCSRFCMRALEQMTELDSLDTMEAQVESPTHSDYEAVTSFKVVPEQRSPPILVDPEVTPLYKSY